MVAVMSLVLCGALVLSACSRSLPSDALEKLKKGMTVEEVESALGRPTTDKVLDSGKRVYIYRADEGYLVVFFVSDKVEHFNRTDKVIFR